jgi:hypothetical protein
MVPPVWLLVEFLSEWGFYIPVARRVMLGRDPLKWLNLRPLEFVYVVLLARDWIRGEA